MSVEKKSVKIEEIEVRIVYSFRRSISITVDPDNGAVIRVPFRTSLKKIEEILLNKSRWIRKAVESCSLFKKIDQNKLFAEGELLMFKGKENNLKISESDKYFVRQEGDTIELGIIGCNDPEVIQALLENWYKKTAKKVFTELLSDLIIKHNNYNFNCTGFSVRKMKKRWGSCSSKGKIAISYDLIRLDLIYGEYVLIHELCHLIHHNHSSEYYKLLSEVFPQWKQVRGELQKYIR
jgi:predicted metal-dependent hydrolase